MSYATTASSHLLYIGTATREDAGGSKGIYALRFDGQSGRFTAPVLATAVNDPTFLALSPDRRFLYSVARLPQPIDGHTGALNAYAINPASGALTFLGTQSSGGNGAVHLAVDRTGRSVYMANYSTGTVAGFPVLPDGRLGPRASFFQLNGTSIAKPKRQTAPFPHSVALSPDNRYLYVPALGQDKILKFKLTPATAMLEIADPAAYVTAPGAGPRHGTFSPTGRFYYSLNELTGTVDVNAYVPATGELKWVQTVAGLPADFKGTNTSAEIRAHPNGLFLYTSNRGHDSITVFARDKATGRLTLVEHVPCGGQHPRNFALSPEGAWLICANRDSNNLVAFAVDPTTGRLTRTGEPAKLDRPVCVLFAQ